MAAPTHMPASSGLVGPPLGAPAGRGTQGTAHVPTATYRLQFGPGFGFSAARALIPLLRRLGISHVYSSPIFAARKGSTHGYDVTNPLCLNPELGGKEEFDALAEDLKRHGMALILDIVPNHMAATAENGWWEDVLENGRESRFGSYFDIDWDAVPDGLRNGVVLPVLGAPLRQVLENGELQLALDDRGFFVRYWEHRFPVSRRSWVTILSHRFALWQSLVGATDPEAAALGRLLVATPTQAIKARLWELYRTRDAVRGFIDGNLKAFNGTKGDPDSFALLERLLRKQNYLLVYWRTGRDQVNYRRFFDVNGLVGMRVEDAEVFDATHGLVLQLIREGKVAGLRIDHIDGLNDPASYLQRLEQSIASLATPRKVYVMAEKITIGHETIPEQWALCGTTGYDFLNTANAVFVDGEKLGRIEETYARFIGNRTGFAELVYREKKRLMHELFAGELSRLAAQLQALAACDPVAVKCRPEEFEAAIEDATARLAVYRTYIRSRDIAPADRRAIESMFEALPYAKRTLSGAVPDFLRRVLLLEYPDPAAAETREWRRFVARWQQFSGPVMAKGMEDTACYIQNRLVSLNVVGGDSRPITVEQFHRFNGDRSRRWPFTLNATSTHDTKRSEDVRARINVLSELPDLWSGCVERWSRWNEGYKRPAGGRAAPDPNDEILLYQVLLGAWPLCPGEVSGFRERIRGFAIKAAREAKTNTNWLEPDMEYERALVGFLDAILEPRPDNRFLPDLLRMESLIAPYGAIGSLAQMLLKIACPGVPDFYQGTLLWDFSLVDPDNRRPVDFKRRGLLFDELPSASIDELLGSWRDGRIKLFTAAKALGLRRAHRDLFLSGGYIPVEVRGPAAQHVIAFARRWRDEWALVTVPRLLASHSLGGDPFRNPGGIDAEIRLPGEAPGLWHDVFTGEAIATTDSVPVSKLLAHFPVALLHRVLATSD